MSFWTPVALSFELAVVTTAVLLVAGLPLACWLALGRGRLRALVRAVASLPLVLPPTVLGFYLLILLGPAGVLGRWLESATGTRLVFSFPGLVVGSAIYSLPFMVQPIENALAALPASLSEASWTLGKSRRETLRRVLLPNARGGVLTGALLCFAHTIGEFGVVLMIGGGIPGRTRVASVALFNEVEAMDYRAARLHALALLAAVLPVLLALELYRSRSSSEALPR
ncbi:MAG: molybdate ABC transporter permease subunit [Elusimicrobia bacterium]|nr:molybdate ABC transporter permease subunit [Elusimicrobiota bacterium]